MEAKLGGRFRGMAFGIPSLSWKISRRICVANGRNFALCWGVSAQASLQEEGFFGGDKEWQINIGYHRWAEEHDPFEQEDSRLIGRPSPRNLSRSRGLSEIAWMPAEGLLARLKGVQYVLGQGFEIEGVVDVSLQGVPPLPVADFGQVVKVVQGDRENGDSSVA